MSRLALAVLALVALPLSTVTAAPAPCASVTVAPPNPLGWYAHSAGGYVEVWHEANGVPGLQRESCVDAGGAFVGPDFRNVNAKVPDESELPCRLQGRFVVCDG